MRCFAFRRRTLVLPPPPLSVTSPVAPVNFALPVISGSAVKGQTLAVSNGAWLNSPTTFVYDWKRGGVSIGVITSSYVLVAADVGAVITCAVTATNTGGSAAATSAGTATVIDLAPVNSVLPAITGTATEGQTLSVSNGTWINTPISYAYQWRRNGVAIGAATAATYLLVTADVGGSITCIVTATNSGGSTPATSTAVGPVGAATAAPVNTVLPVLTGAAFVGQRLFSGNGSWDITPTSYTYQWYSELGILTGEIADNYLIVDTDIGRQFHCAVTAYNIAAPSAPASSAATATVADRTIAKPTLTRTSSSGVTPMTFSIAVGSDVFAGDELHIQVASDSTFGSIVMLQDIYHVIAEADLVTPFTPDLSDCSPSAFSNPGATDYMRVYIETVTPQGRVIVSPVSDAISPTDAVAAVAYSASDKTAGTNLSGGNLTASWPTGGFNSVRATRGSNTQKWYDETHIDSQASGVIVVGVADSTTFSNWAGDSGQPGASDRSDAELFYSASDHAATGFTFAPGDIIMRAYDPVNHLLYLGKNGTWQLGANPSAGTGGIAVTGTTGMVYPIIQVHFGSGQAVTTNFGASAFTYTLPTGFTAIP